VESDTQFAFGSGYQGTPTLIIQNSDGTNRDIGRSISISSTSSNN